MKKVLLSVVGFLGLLRLLPDEWREQLSRLPGVMISQMMENMPDE